MMAGMNQDYCGRGRRKSSSIAVDPKLQFPTKLLPAKIQSNMNRLLMTNINTSKKKN